ncbi:F-box domain-containing protein [Mycena venus]|uniref:F-box domain-containing protein n=1 Tax=Mycena venus TaxID=2733690 RepID=A0A8H6XKL6_9AGAR|nr:F-box domain-containing protein [Mycena venus]
MTPQTPPSPGKPSKQTRLEDLSSRSIYSILAPRPKRAALAAERAFIADLDAQIWELQSSLRPNAYRCPALTIPDEIVLEIFLHFLPIYPKCPPPISLLSPYLLCHICRKWRAIAIGTPSLWRAISLSLHRTRRLQHTYSSLDMSLRLSGSRPLSIKLSSPLYDAKFAQFGQSIAGHFARLEHLELLFPKLLHVLPHELLSLPVLRSLKLGVEENMSVALSFLAAPLLQKVAIGWYCEYYRLIFPWSQLTVLSVDWISLNQFMSLLHQLTNIIHCRCLFRLRGATETNTRPSSRNVTLPYLETLVANVFAVDSTVSQALLDYTDPIATLVALVSRSGCDLQELCITDAATISRSSSSYAALSLLASRIFDSSGRLDVTEPFFSKEDDGDDTYSSDKEDMDSDLDWEAIAQRAPRRKKPWTLTNTQKTPTLR